jgi:hypothetical protein
MGPPQAGKPAYCAAMKPTHCLIYIITINLSAIPWHRFFSFVALRRFFERSAQSIRSGAPAGLRGLAQDSLRGNVLFLGNNKFLSLFSCQLAVSSLYKGLQAGTFLDIGETVYCFLLAAHHRAL